MGNEKIGTKGEDKGKKQELEEKVEGRKSKDRQGKGKEREREKKVKDR